MIKSQINFCRFVFRILNILVQCDILKGDLKEKILFLLSKNIQIKMLKLNELVAGKNTLFLDEFASYNLSKFFDPI